MAKNLKDTNGKPIIFSRMGYTRGTIVKVAWRYCYECKRIHKCYIVNWEDGTRGIHCPRVVHRNRAGNLEII